MGDLIASINESLQDPHARHAMAVHLPVAGALLAVPLTIALACTGFRNHGLRWSAAAVLFFSMVGAGVAAGAGEEAIANIRQDRVGGLTEAQSQALENHEGYGEGGWMWPGAALVLVVATSLPKKKARLIIGIGALGASLAVMGWATLAGHTGGTLVYTHGLGVPAPAAETPPDTATVPSGPGSVAVPESDPEPDADDAP